MMITKICEMKKGNKKGSAIVPLANVTVIKHVFLEIVFLKIISISRL